MPAAPPPEWKQIEADRWHYESRDPDPSNQVKVLGTVHRIRATLDRYISRIWSAQAAEFVQCGESVSLDEALHKVEMLCGVAAAQAMPAGAVAPEHPIECACSECNLRRFSERHSHAILCICPECERKYTSRPIDCFNLNGSDAAELAAIFAAHTRMKKVI